MERATNASLWRLCWRFAALTILIGSTLFVTGRSNAQGWSDKCSPCDTQWGICGYHCPDWDPYCAQPCDNQWLGCVTSCITSNNPYGNGPATQPEKRCRSYATRVYQSCTDGTDPECTNGDGTIDYACCVNLQTQEYFGCRYP